ncbi:alpha-L-fucosidase [Chitinophaga polysaccharea]|uniref:alpha-L-fucosidase n=1 Tax=Chitinophaga polysaccharea TaxID=1293035 RepID=UPI0014551EB9|nr:alpha-L-fucosidase [Chitinophaga polysaccharea]NLR61224.1 alpha-L-fucosidase [Chitinophaga polysaccharea]
MKRLLVLGVLAMQLFTTANAQEKTNPEEIKEKMQWFADAKLGIFIHWGIYSVNGIDESWSFHNKKISYPDYMRQLKGFTASNYNPQAWADLIKESGARYAVMTTKHHDGVALWGSKYSKLNVAKSTPAKRDVLTPFFAALRRDSIKCGAYFSLIDWSYPDYPQFLKDSNRYDIKAQPERWKKFLGFYEGQMAEVMNKFNPDLWWFDGDWEHSAEEWEAPKMRKMLTDHNPNTIINGRLQGYGDYDTPEQNFPVTRPHFHWWELCMTINNNWGWQPQDTNWKTPYEIITIFADAVANGGNLLLDIGPRADGSIPDEEVHLLKELGAWNKRNGEAIFNTIGGIPQGHFYGPTTLSKDSTTLFLFLAAKTSGPIMVKGLSNKIESITVLGNNTPLSHKIVGKISWSPVPGLVYIDVPEQVQDKYVTVLKVKLDKAVKLYRGKGGFLTNE